MVTLPRARATRARTRPRAESAGARGGRKCDPRPVLIPIPIPIPIPRTVAYAPRRPAGHGPHWAAAVLAASSFNLLSLRSIMKSKSSRPITRFLPLNS